MRSHSYLNSAKKIIALYDGSVPLAAWLKEYFRSNKKFGSKDRREVAHLCYCYYRLGNAFRNMEQEERILLGLFLCSEDPNLVLRELRPQWNERVTESIDQKLEAASVLPEVYSLFPFVGDLSEQIDAKTFLISHLIQPSLFLRLRPGRQQKVLHDLDAAGVKYEKDGDCIRLPNGTKVDEIVKIDSEAVIQDLNSQKTLDSFQLQTPNSKSQTSAWDCCAASGGKSILFHDLYPSAHITVSDIRASILANLQKRFAVAGIKKYESFIADVSSDQFSFSKKFDVVICDAPCSGSGTWSRTPEQLFFFNREKIALYTSVQKKISVNAARAVSNGGFFIYITCSVFSSENEEVAEHIKANTKLKPVTALYLKGYDKKADTLFVAVFSL